MIYRIINGSIIMIVCVSVICCTGPAWADVQPMKAPAGAGCGAANMPASSGRSFSGMSQGSNSFNSGVSSFRSNFNPVSAFRNGMAGNTFNPVSAFNSGMTGARAAVQASPSVTPNTAVTTGQKTVGPVGGLKTFVSTHNISSTGITANPTPGTDKIKTATDVTATSATNIVDTAATTQGPGVQQSPVNRVPGVYQKFDSMSVDQKMEILEYGNGSIWNYQETKNDIGPDGQPLWKSAKSVFADMVSAMSSTGQYTDADGNIITNSPFGNNGAGYFQDYEITPGPKANGSWDIVNAAAQEWFAKNNIDLSCGLQEAQWDRFINDMKIFGYIDYVGSTEQQRDRNNPLNTRANWEAYLNGQPIDTSRATGNWQLFDTGTFFNASPRGNNPWDGFIDNRSFVSQYIEVNMDATSADWANAEAEFQLLYGNVSCASDNQLAYLKQSFYENKKLIRPLRFFP